MCRSAQCTNKKESCDSVWVLCCDSLGNAAAVAMSHEEEGLLPRQGIGNRNRMLSEVVQVEGIGSGTRPSTFPKPRHIESSNVDNL